MQAYQIGSQTGIGSLQLVERPDPEAGPGQVVLKVRLVCLNHRDLLVLAGTYGAKRPETRIPLSEGIGEVVAVGEGVTSSKVGVRAIFPHFATWLGGTFSPAAFGTDIGISHDGWLAEYVVAPAAALVAVPDSLSDEQVAPLASSALTAWNALVEVGNIKAGDTVLALGTGGVSIFALQIAKARGARVAITSSSDTKLALARKLGADITINYTANPDWSTELMKLTGGSGADIVVETGGQATLSQSIAATAPNARIVIIGALAGAASEGLPNYGTIIGKNLILRGIAEGSREMLAALVRAVDANGIRPVIDHTFMFDQAQVAYEHLKSGNHVGKVLIKVS